MHDLKLLAADAIEPAVLHRAFSDAFSDYLIGPFELTLAQWPQFIARQAVDLSLSRAALKDGEIAAFLLVAPRVAARSWRVGTMGSPPAARGSGAARVLLEDFIARARDAGLRRVELECFAQNERALKLYRSHGFEAVHALHGYAVQGDAPPDAATIEAVGLEEAYRWIDAFPASTDLPLQVTPAVLRTLTSPPQVWRFGSAQAVLSLAPDGSVVFNSLLDRNAAQDDALALVKALQHRFAGARMNVPQLQRPDVGGEALLRAGFERLPLFQWWMRCEL